MVTVENPKGLVAAQGCLGNVCGGWWYILLVHSMHLTKVYVGVYDRGGRRHDHILISIVVPLILGWIHDPFHRERYQSLVMIQKNECEK